jgi:cytosine/adenosine deaminase-related metal-dependent hydrolase
MPVTVIRKAEMVVAWDAAAKSHVYMPDADVVFEGGVLRFVGRVYDGPADEVVSGSGVMVMPAW